MKKQLQYFECQPHEYTVYGYVRQYTEVLNQILPIEISQICLSFYHTFNIKNAKRQLTRKLNRKIRQRPYPYCYSIYNQIKLHPYCYDLDYEYANQIWEVNQTNIKQIIEEKMRTRPFPEEIKARRIVPELYINNWILPDSSDTLQTIEDVNNEYKKQNEERKSIMSRLHNKRKSPEEMVERGIIPKQYINVVIGNKDFKHLINEQQDVKEWMKYNNIFDQYLYVMLAMECVDCIQDLKELDISKLDLLLRKVRTDKFAKIKNKNERKKVDELLIKFEKKWKLLKINNENQIKQWMKKNKVYYKYLYNEFQANNIQTIDDLITINNIKLDEILRKVRSERFIQAKDEKSRNKVDKKLIKFEKKWRNLPR
eukprot:440333_1